MAAAQAGWPRAIGFLSTTDCHLDLRSLVHGNSGGDDGARRVGVIRLVDAVVGDLTRGRGWSRSRADDDSAGLAPRKDHRCVRLHRQADRGGLEEGAVVKPAKSAADDEFLRRVYLDLARANPQRSRGAGVSCRRAKTTTGEAGRVPAQSSRFRQELRDPVDDPADRPGNQGRMVDRRALSSWLRKQFAADRPWNEVVHELVTRRAPTKKTARSITCWPTWSSARFR